MKVYNFAPGPATLPEEVKLEAQRDFVNYNNSGMSVTEMSHRSKVYEEIHNEAQSLLAELMGISDDYKIFFCRAGQACSSRQYPSTFSPRARPTIS